MGLVLFRTSEPQGETDAPTGVESAATVEVLIGHMGGPFWARKDEGAWSFPKGLVEETDVTADGVARREFAEELGLPAPDGPVFDLGVTPGGRKRIRLLAMHVSVDALDPGLHDDALAAGIDGGTFDMEWPPKSGRTASFPEIDRAAWVTLDVAALKLSKNQRDAVERVAALATTIAAQPGS